MEPAKRLKKLDDSWGIVDNHHLSRTFAFVDFAGALAFVNRVGAVAEELGHHPNISFTWGKVRIDIWSHDAGAMTAADFELAAKIDRLGS